MKRAKSTIKQITKAYSWKKEHTRLFKSLVPARGQANTLQGELIRITGKLTDEAFRNGNMNWDADHERLWRFVGRHLDGATNFSAQDHALIRKAIEEIIQDYATPDLSGDGSCYYIISEKVVDWCMAHPTPITNQKDKTLKR